MVSTATHGRMVSDHHRPKVSAESGRGQATHRSSAAAGATAVCQGRRCPQHPTYDLVLEPDIPCLTCWRLYLQDGGCRGQTTLDHRLGDARHYVWTQADLVKRLWRMIRSFEVSP